MQNHRPVVKELQLLVVTTQCSQGWHREAVWSSELDHRSTPKAWTKGIVTYWDLIGIKGLLTARLRSMSCTFFSSTAKLNCISAMSRCVGVFICLFLKVVWLEQNRGNIRRPYRELLGTSKSTAASMSLRGLPYRLMTTFGIEVKVLQLGWQICSQPKVIYRRMISTRWWDWLWFVNYYVGDDARSKDAFDVCCPCWSLSCSCAFGENICVFSYISLSLHMHGSLETARTSEHAFLHTNRNRFSLHDVWLGDFDRGPLSLRSLGGASANCEPAKSRVFDAGFCKQKQAHEKAYEGCD